eukprot:5948617-Prymnesium_polylepis.1
MQRSSRLDPEALQKDLLTPLRVRGNCSACPDGAPSIPRTGSIKINLRISNVCCLMPGAVNMQ